MLDMVSLLAVKIGSGRTIIYVWGGWQPPVGYRGVASQKAARF